MYGHFKRQTSEISQEKTSTWLRKGNLKWETEPFLIATQNNAIRTNYIKARTDKTQQNGRCRLYGDRDKTINHMMSECRKLVQIEYKTRHKWVGMVIQWELCNKFQFDPMNKWYMHNSEPVLENEMHKILWDFEIQTDHLISARRPILVIVNKKKKKKKKKKRTCRIVNFTVPAEYWVKLKESEKRDKYLDLARELKNYGR